MSKKEELKQKAIELLNDLKKTPEFNNEAVILGLGKFFIRLFQDQDTINKIDKLVNSTATVVNNAGKQGLPPGVIEPAAMRRSQEKKSQESSLTEKEEDSKANVPPVENKAKKQTPKKEVKIPSSAKPTDENPVEKEEATLPIDFIKKATPAEIKKIYTIEELLLICSEEGITFESDQVPTYDKIIRTLKLDK